MTCVNTYIGGIAISNDSPNETKNIRLYAVQCGAVFSKSGMPYGQKSAAPAGTVPRHHRGLGQGTCSVGLDPRLMLGGGHQNRVVVFTMGRDRFIRCTAHIKQWVT